MAKNNPKSVVQSTFDNSFADPAVSNKAWERYKSNGASTEELPLEDPSGGNKRNIKGFINWRDNETPKKNK